MASGAAAAFATAEAKQAYEAAKYHVPAALTLRFQPVELRELEQTEPRAADMGAYEDGSFRRIAEQSTAMMDEATNRVRIGALMSLESEARDHPEETGYDYRDGRIVRSDTGGE